MIDSNGETTTFGYDTFARATSRSGPGAVGAVRTTSYNDYFGWSPTQSRRTETISDGTTPVATEVFLDGLGREIRSLRTAKRPDSGSPAVIERTTAYDLRGNVRSGARPRFCVPGGASCDPSLGSTTLLYDPRDRLAFVVQPDGGVEVHRYETRVDPGRTDAERYHVSIDAAGRRRDIRLDGADNIAQLIEYESPTNYAIGIQRTNYLYDGLDRLQLLCDPLAAPCTVAGRDVKHTTLFTYDTMSRLTRRDDPDRGPWRYRFRGDGAPLRQTDGNGVATVFAYDSLYGRRKTVDWAGNGTLDVTYVYGDELGGSAPVGSRGRLYQKVGPTSTLEFAYDSSGRVSQRKRTFSGTGEQYTEGFTYDWRNRLTSRTYSDGETISRTYDVMGLDRITSAARVYVDRLDFNADLKPTTYVFGNAETRTRSYQATIGYLQSILDVKTGQPAVLNRSYTYDLTGMVASVSDSLTPSESLTGLTYDGLGRLTVATRGGGQPLVYGYDVVSNLASKEGVTIPFQHASKPHAPASSSNPTLYQHDPAGNMTGKTGRTFGFDARNRLGSVSGTRPVTFQYDDSTERVTKTVGADRSVFLGPDVEVMNRVRLVKTIRAVGEIVARVETIVSPGQGARVTPAAPSSDHFRLVDERVGLLLFLSVAALAGALQRGARGTAPTRAAASSLAMAVIFLPVLARSANAAIKGDVTNDGRVDAADVLRLTRHVNDGVALPVDPSTGDVAPFALSGALGDNLRNSADVLVLARAVTEPDLDADGLSPSLEATVGTSPLLADTNMNGIPDGAEDSDQDGVTNSLEITNGTNPALADTDGDGIVDGRDAAPTVFDGDRAVWVHTDHLGSVAVLSNSAGAAIRTISYDLWGAIRSNIRVGGAVSLDSGEKFTGQRFDEETSLAYYGARYYDPALGRFITTDSIVEANYSSYGLQPYGYARNSPVNFVDPSGNFLATPPGGGVGSNAWPARGLSPSPDLASALNGLLYDAMSRAIAQNAALPRAAKSGPERSSQSEATVSRGPGAFFETTEDGVRDFDRWVRSQDPQELQGGEYYAVLNRTDQGFSYDEPTYYECASPVSCTGQWNWNPDTAAVFLHSHPFGSPMQGGPNPSDPDLRTSETGNRLGAVVSHPPGSEPTLRVYLRHPGGYDDVWTLRGPLRNGR